jgi:predicted phage terminase large subunit-like protein
MPAREQAAPQGLASTKIVLTAKHIEGFVNMFLRKDFDGPTEIPPCHREWWEMVCSPHRKVAIAAPRNHAKSTAITHSYTLANIVMRCRRFILIVSDTEQQAVHFLGDIKKALVDNEDIVKVFGIRTLLKDTETDCVVEFEDGYQCRIIAKGSEQKLRGIKWNNMRPDLIMCDDMENDEIVMNDDRRKKFRDWFMSALLPCMSVSGIVRYVGTILHMDAMLERLMPKEHDKSNAVVLCIRRSPYRAYWYSAKYKAHDPSFDHVLWPTRFSAQDLKDIRGGFIEQGQLDKYSQEYLNVPIDESNSFFKRSDFCPMQDKDAGRNMLYYIGVDLSVTLSSKADYTVMIVGGVDEDGILNIVEVVRSRMDSVEIVQTILDLNKKYDPQYFFFEKGAITNSVLPHLHVSMLEQNNYVTYELFARIVDKASFAQTIRARMRMHRVKFAKKEDWYPDLEGEMLKFPRLGIDDQVDSMAILGRGLEKFIEAPTVKEVAEEEYLEEMMASEVNDQGRSAVTGY